MAYARTLSSSHWRCDFHSLLRLIRVPPSPPHGGADRNTRMVEEIGLEVASPPHGGADRDAADRCRAGDRKGYTLTAARIGALAPSILTFKEVSPSCKSRLLVPSCESCMALFSPRMSTMENEPWHLASCIKPVAVGCQLLRLGRMSEMVRRLFHLSSCAPRRTCRPRF